MICEECCGAPPSHTLCDNKQEEFYAQKKWRQVEQKKAKFLF